MSSRAGSLTQLWQVYNETKKCLENNIRLYYNECIFILDINIDIARQLRVILDITQSYFLQVLRINYKHFMFWIITNLKSRIVYFEN